MSLSRVVFKGSKYFPVRKDMLLDNYLSSHFQKLTMIPERNYRKAYPGFLKTMKVRRKIAGPEKERKRSEWFDWNYNTELYAFNKRLYEKISEDNLRCIFVHDSYVEREQQNRKDMEVQDVQLNLKSNSALVILGQDVISKFLKRYLRHCFKLMPEDGISAVHDYLISDEVLSHISSNLGTKDLIFCAEYPPEKKTLAATLKAVVGGIVSSDSIERAETFVLDFICTQLIGKDLLEMWEFDEPLKILDNVLNKQGREPTESRLIFESGRNTIESIYHVGLYSAKEFLGKGAGETLAFAEEMAAYDALRRIFELNETNKPLPFGETAKRMEFKFENKHMAVNELCNKSSVKNVVST